MEIQYSIKRIIILLAFLTAGTIKAQNDTIQTRCVQSSVLVEAMFGNEYSSYQVVVNKQIGSPDSRFPVFATPYLIAFNSLIFKRCFFILGVA